MPVHSSNAHYYHSGSVSLSDLLPDAIDTLGQRLADTTDDLYSDRCPPTPHRYRTPDPAAEPDREAPSASKFSSYDLLATDTTHRDIWNGYHDSSDESYNPSGFASSSRAVNANVWAFNSYTPMTPVFSSYEGLPPSPPEWVPPSGSVLFIAPSAIHLPSEPAQSYDRPSPLTGFSAMSFSPASTPSSASLALPQLEPDSTPSPFAHVLPELTYPASPAASTPPSSVCSLPLSLPDACPSSPASHGASDSDAEEYIPQPKRVRAPARPKKGALVAKRPRPSTAAKLSSISSKTRPGTHAPYRNLQVTADTPWVQRGNPLACGYCDWVQCNSRGPDLKRHVASHMHAAGEKLFWCDDCGHKFSRKDALKRHLGNAKLGCGKSG